MSDAAKPAESSENRCAPSIDSVRAQDSTHGVGKANASAMLPVVPKGSEAEEARANSSPQLPQETSSVAAGELRDKERRIAWSFPDAWRIPVVIVAALLAIVAGIYIFRHRGDTSQTPSIRVQGTNNVTVNGSVSVTQSQLSGTSNSQYNGVSPPNVLTSGDSGVDR